MFFPIEFSDAAPTEQPPREIPQEARDAVNRGIVFLDEKKPRWAFEVEKDALNMNDYFSCLLGQLYGTYNYGLSVLNIGLSESYHLGFDITGYTAYGFDDLNALWIEAIESRIS